MENPFNFFDKIYVISADKSDRRPYIKKVLGELGIKFEFYDAIMGNNLTDEEIAAIYDDKAFTKSKII